MNSRTGPLRAGLIGFGLAGRYFHAPLLLAAGIRIVAVVTSRAGEVREVLPGAQVVESAQALIERDDIDLVVVASPNSVHAEQTRAALLAGKHVVVDKPLCLTAAEARELAQLAAKCARQLTVFQNRRWAADFLTLRRLIETDRLGRINAFHVRWNRYRPQVIDRWRERDEPGAGILYDLGSHMIDQVLCLFGRPEWIQADVFAQRPGAVVDDAFEILMGKGTLRVTLGVSLFASAVGWRYCVHGSRASFVKEGMDPQESQLRAGMQANDPSFGVEPEEIRGKIIDGASGHEQLVPSERGDWISYYRNLQASIETGAPVPVPAEEAAVTIELIEAARRSSREGRRISL
jgi:scyllo-inositol 2-dehydrogenase (NADP+)